MESKAISHLRSKMRIYQNWRWGYSCCGLLLFFSWFQIWRYVTSPSPDFQYPEFFSNFINYLVLSQSIGNDFFYIITLGFNSDYPLGFSLFPFLISLFGMESVFLEDPWRLNFFFYLPLCFLPLLFDWSRSRVILFFFTLLFFPVTQIMLKGFNPQTPIIIFTLAAICCYLRFLDTNRKLHLAGFVFFAWFAIIIKHLGVFYFGVFFLTLFFWRILRKEKPWLECKLALSLIVLCAPFYPLEGLRFYLSHVVQAHNPILGTFGFFTLSAVVMALIWVVLILLRKHQRGATLPLLTNSVLVLLVCCSLTVFCLWADTDASHSLALSLMTLISGLFLAGVLIIRFDLSSTRALSYLLCVSFFTACTTLYLSMVGHTAYIGYLPLLLLLVLTIHESPMEFQLFSLLLVFVAISNFFPGREAISRSLDDEHFYFRFFYSVYQNPLGWDQNPLPAARNEFVKILESYEYDQIYYETGLPMASVDLDLDVFGFLYDLKTYFPIPKTNQLEPQDFVGDHLHELKNGDFSVFHDWVEREQVLVFFREHKPHQDPGTAMENILGEFIQEASADPGIIGERDVLSLFSMYLEILRGSDRAYRSHLFKIGEKSYEVLVHPLLKRKQFPSEGPNYFLYKQIRARS
jgi:hypothetical protein